MRKLYKGFRSVFFLLKETKQNKKTNDHIIIMDNNTPINIILTYMLHLHQYQ